MKIIIAKIFERECWQGTHLIPTTRQMYTERSRFALHSKRRMIYYYRSQTHSRDLGTPAVRLNSCQC